ncbi:MAG TPA: MarR family winged helix-turn-helix transcriptional regulator [Pilimelia sp.]|nr:MarR family winged helix-turn-helix transcriptional regulator [Pilimelia sp.]
MANGGPEGPSAAQPDHAVLAGLLAVSRALVGLTARSLSELPTELTLPQYRVLLVLAAHGPLRAGDLATELGLAPSTVTRNCDRLVRRGLLRRFRRPEDRRGSWLALTGSGTELIGTVQRHRRDQVASLLSRADPPAPERFAAGLAALAEAAGELPEQVWWQRWAASARGDD